MPSRNSGGSDCVFFFFQAEDGIRDLIVTGVQTCALPICTELRGGARTRRDRLENRPFHTDDRGWLQRPSGERRRARCRRVGQNEDRSVRGEIGRASWRERV